MEFTNIHNAKTNFSKYLKKVSEGDEIIICSANTPIAKLVPYVAHSNKRMPGALKGKIKIGEDFDILPQSFTQFFY